MVKSAKKSASTSLGKGTQKSDEPQQGNRIRLADFIHDNIKPIVTEWEAFAKTLTPASNEITPLALKASAAIDLRDYGTILHSGWGEPSEQLKAELREKYGMYE
jgi:hypothetical protein